MYVYSESAEEPNPEKPYPFLFSMSRRAAHYLYAEVKVFEHQNPTAARDLEVYRPAIVDAGRAAPGDHALQLHRYVCLVAFNTLPKLSAYKSDVRSYTAGRVTGAGKSTKLRGGR